MTQNMTHILYVLDIYNCSSTIKNAYKLETDRILSDFGGLIKIENIEIDSSTNEGNSILS